MKKYLVDYSLDMADEHLRRVVVEICNGKPNEIVDEIVRLRKEISKLSDVIRKKYHIERGTCEE